MASQTHSVSWWLPLPPSHFSCLDFLLPTPMHPMRSITQGSCIPWPTQSSAVSSILRWETQLPRPIWGFSMSFGQQECQQFQHRNDLFLSYLCLSSNNYRNPYWTNFILIWMQEHQYLSHSPQPNCVLFDSSSISLFFPFSHSKRKLFVMKFPPKIPIPCWYNSTAWSQWQTCFVLRRMINSLCSHGLFAF